MAHWGSECGVVRVPRNSVPEEVDAQLDTCGHSPTWEVSVLRMPDQCMSNAKAEALRCFLENTEDDVKEQMVNRKRRRVENMRSSMEYFLDCARSSERGQWSS